MDFFRKMVSGDKRRYVTDKFNLDLTYITDRVIAMAFPATGVESTFRNDGTQVAALMKESHPGHFRIYNLTERKYDTTMFEGRVLDCGWFDHHAPPIGQLFEIVENIHNFLLEDRDNVVSIHCLAGKGRTGTVIVSYLLYSGLFHDPEEAARYFALRRSSNNWGVTGPSQQRYIRYFWEILKNRRAPNLSTPLRLVSLTMNSLPKFTVGTKRSFTPIIAAVDVSGGLTQQSIWMSRGDRTFTDENEKIVFDLKSGPEAPNNPVLLLGDINFTMDTWGAFGRKSKFARFAFNTGMLINDQESQFAEDVNNGGADSSNIDRATDRIVIKFPKNELDDACSDKRTPYEFEIELTFERVWTRDWTSFTSFLTKPDAEMWQRIFSEYRDTNGVACFKPRPDMSLVQIIAKARALTDARSGEPPKLGGWLTKRGHRIKNWKRRWFALHADTLEYSTKPKSTTPAGIIKLDDIIAVQQADPAECEFPNSFIIYTNWNDFLCYAQHESDMEEWINTLNLALQLREQKRQLSTATIGQLAVTVLEISNVPCNQYYALVAVGSQISKAATTNSFGKEIVFDVYQKTESSMNIQLWEENTYLPDAILGEIQVLLDMIHNDALTHPLELVQWYNFRHQITRIKLKIVYRPKVWLEAQRSPANAPLRHASSTSNLVPVPLNNNLNTAHANTSNSSPLRSLTLSSKSITTSELKELVEILDASITDALQDRDMDRSDFEQSWDWSLVSPLSPSTSSSALQMARENRYSATTHLIDEDLPIYMRPISLDIWLPPSSSFSSAPNTGSSSISPRNIKLNRSFTSASPLRGANTTNTTTTVVAEKKAIHLDLSTLTTTTTEPLVNTQQTPLSPLPYNATPGSIKQQMALRAKSPPPVTSRPVAESFSTVVVEPASQVKSVTRAVSPPLNNRSGPTTIGQYKASPLSSSGTNSPSSDTLNVTSTRELQTSPEITRSSSSSSGIRSPALSSPQIGHHVKSASTTSAPSSSANWIGAITPSENAIAPFLGRSGTEPRELQMSGNTARDKRRRERRPTTDSQNPPQFQEMDKIVPVMGTQQEPGVSSTPSSPETPISHRNGA